MTWNLHGTHACEGDLAELVGLRHKHFILKLVKGGVFHTHRGILRHDELIGMPWGSQVFSHNGSPFFLLQPPIGDVLRELPRNTQIIYPKELGFILVNMGIGPGQHVVEAGTGSGALTCAFAYIIGSEGRVTSYEVRPDMQNMARRNLDRLGLLDRVELKLQSIESGFDETGVDALFLDLPNPEDYIPQVRCALKSGGFFGSILPTANQVERLLIALRKNDFAFVEVCEIMLRYYKPEPQRFRPTDRMVAHTGYLIFGRPVIIDHSEASRLLLDEAGLVDAQQTPEELDLNHQYNGGTNGE
ncbi:MAG TPA: tRNA (adenine-N1)-methyltransferase [Anaerolineaceae bacterium]|nr:tRNA (adenine-N1)-methyltransferase [Anaerolineaceae bacterium]HOU43225.1 tRNA (adenine-N1)-methyltransferase [Anaerolineaceae bacterium]HQF44704.1 tRNA (adenine-N1)-methyltransferase [Anaerolineaceae bacterium]HQH36461.1 tRNA (adenine-N1)-methyltransferase [Anaerolineaceae bacterium]HQO96471.1 tRNA (adenine-N1)-methyltransferase [Anaerolineaceae bacterium]